MKNFIFAFLFLFSVQASVGQTEWAPVGAKWWVYVVTDFPFQEFINQYECTGTIDTLGHTCKVVHEKSFGGIEQDLLYYQEDSKVYFYDAFLEEFVLYFDYSKQAGESYQIINGQDTVIMSVDSVNFKIFGGESIKVQHGKAINPNVEFSEPYNQIYEGIGTYIGLEPSLPSNFTFEIWYYLACYLKPDGTLYNMNPDLDIDCQALSTSTKNIKEVTHLVLYPNPATKKTSVLFNSSPTISSQWTLIDQLGRTVKQEILAAGQQEQEIELEEVGAGLYFWKLSDEGGSLATGKLIVLK